MGRQYKTVGYVVLGLIIVGLLVKLLENPEVMIVPIVVLGVIYYFYKFPPKSYRKNLKSNRIKRKTSFKLIQGNKKDESDDSPRYH